MRVSRTMPNSAKNYITELLQRNRQSSNFNFISKKSKRKRNFSAIFTSLIISIFNIVPTNAVVEDGNYPCTGGGFFRVENVGDYVRVVPLTEGVAPCAGTANIPDGVDSIQGTAFSGAIGLTSVNVPDTVNDISSEAFDDLTSLQTINMASNSFYSSVAGVLFNGDQTSLIRFPEGKTGSYTIPNSVTSISLGAFKNSNLSTLNFPNLLETIGYQAFTGARYLSTLTIPSSVVSIANNVFDNASALEEIIVADGNVIYSAVNGVLLETGESEIFLIKCPEGKIGNYTIPNSVTVIDNAAFKNSRLTNISIPNSVTYLGSQAFENAQLLTDVNIGNGISTLRLATFKGATSLRSVIFGAGSSLDCIDDEVFFGATSLTSINIPNSVSEIDSSAFRGASALQSINMDSNSSYSSVEGVLFNGDQTELLKFPEGKSGRYTIPETVTHIGSRAFVNNLLTNISIPSTVDVIYSRAFADSTTLRSVNFEDNSELIINFMAFGNNSSLRNFIFLGDAPTSINEDAFSDVAAGAKAYVSAGSTGFGDEVDEISDGLWFGLVVSNDTPPADDEPSSGGGSETSTPSVSTSSAATKSVDASFKLTNRKYLSKFEIRKAITKDRSFKRKPIAIYKYSISKASKKNCLMRGNYVMRLKENGVCEITVTRSTKKGIKSKFQVKINYTNNVPFSSNFSVLKSDQVSATSDGGGG